MNGMDELLQEHDPDSCRYDCLGALNRGYCQGDGSSWQRYTVHPPVPCLLHLDATDPLLLRVMPEQEGKEGLDFDSSYALLLQNGVPCLPDSELDGPLLSFSHCAGVGEDKLIFFSTEKDPSMNY
jgi:hypothetical protein